MRPALRTPAVLLLASLFLVPTTSGQTNDLPTIETKTNGLQKRDGYFPIWWDDDQGKVWLEVSRLEDDFLYAVSLAAGLGSNDVGLDRNQLGPQKLVRFRRIGRKLLLVAPNLDFRASTVNDAERKAVEDAFATSIVHSFEIVARTGDRFLVEATPFILKDAHGVVSRLRSANQGSFKLDAARSAPNPDVLKAFPKNTEMEAWLTFESDAPGGWVRSVAADPTAVSLRVRHSFVELPPPGFRPRAYDPRSGFFSMQYADYSTPIGEDMVKRFIMRHRLEKQDPTAELSDPVEPIVYYVDPGTPEPVLSALIEGGRWWAQAFSSAGFRNAFRVDVLPDSADALDARYNMINWVHRSTRGWSYGSTLSDPRTGEIIKGHVALGSLRIRQDYLIFEGVLSPYATGIPLTDPMLAAAIARIRQLSAHEIGHTIGLAHNYVASTHDRASVMDYPAPLITVKDGVFNLMEAYARGIGDWDRVAIRYGYTQFPDSIDTIEKEREALNGILVSAQDAGLIFLTDQDARPSGSAHPLAHLWDNLATPRQGLDVAVDVRREALNRLGINSIRPDQPLALLQELLVPTYLYHRYQLEAVSKLVGGSYYSFGLRNRPAALPSPVPGSEQRMALSDLMALIEPTELALPKGLRGVIPPRPPGYRASVELFSSFSDPMFDAYVPAQVLSELVISLVLDPARAARLMYQADTDASLPSLSDVLASGAERIWAADVPIDDYHAEIQRIVQQTWVDEVISVLERASLAPGVRARFRQHLVDLRAWITEHPGSDYETIAHRSLAYDEIDRYLVRLYDRAEPMATPPTPPGQPIGSGEAALGRRDSRQSWLAAWDERMQVCSMDAW